MSRQYGQAIKDTARNLRSQGWPIGEICLKIHIPKNTFSGWIKDIQQKKRIKRICRCREAFSRKSKPGKDGEMQIRNQQ
jgi:hypothetical protein